MQGSLNGREDILLSDRFRKMYQNNKKMCSVYPLKEMYFLHLAQSVLPK